jgi:hypothetical protein
MQTRDARIDHLRNVKNREKLSPVGVPAQLEADAQGGCLFKMDGLVQEQNRRFLGIQAGSKLV